MTRHNRHHRITLALLAGTIIGGLGIDAMGMAGWAATDPATDAAVAPKPGAIQPTAPANKLADFSDLVAQVKPAVVSITVHIKHDDADDSAQSFGQTLPFPFGGMLPHRQNRADGSTGIGLSDRPGWHGRDQQPCGARRGKGERHAG